MRNALLMTLVCAACSLIPSFASAITISKPTNNLGLVGYWALNEGAGTVAGDSSGNGNTGTFAGSPTWVGGKFGGALRFGGSGNVDAGDINAMDGTSALTMSAWMRRASPNAAVILEKSATGCSPFDMTGIDMWTDGNIYFMVRDGDYHGGAQVQNDTEWHHVVMVFDGNLSGQGLRLRGYIDGVLQPFDAGYVEPPAATASNANSFNIGYSDCTGSSSDGDIDDVRVYNRALSEAQVAALYTTGAARVGASSAVLQNGSTLASGLVGLWTFDGPDVTDKVYDKSGQGNNGYFIGGATSSAKTIGKLGQALRFNDSYVDAGDINAMDGASVLTMSAWMRRASLNAPVSMIKGPDCGGAVTGIDMWTDGNIYFNVENGGITYGGQTHNDTEWHHVVLVFDGNLSGGQERLKGYIDGVLQAFDAGYEEPPATTASNTDHLYIGRNDCAGTNSNGYIDDVRVYSRALTAAEVKQLYSLGR